MPRIAYTGAVYHPPRPDLPHVAVVFGAEGEVEQAMAVDSIRAGQAFINRAFEGCLSETRRKLAL